MDGDCSNKAELVPSETTSLPVNKPEFSSWYISISFGKSTSSNYSKALYLAKKAPIYLEEKQDGAIIHQAVYGKAPTEYLAFVQLYELVSNWKSAFVVINGEFVDRKIVGNINYCYGDKCRSGKNDFCFGASFWTDNPFGCHRAQMHYGNNPWYSFGVLDAYGVFHVDIKKIVEELKSRLGLYKHCPALNMDDVVARATNLPKTINPHKQPEWEYATHYAAGISKPGVQPKMASIGGTYEIRVSLDDLLPEDTSKPKKEISATGNSLSHSSGCLLPVIMTIVLIIMCF